EAQARQQRLRIDKDKLSFTVKSERDGFVHLLVYGPDGSLMVLFPRSDDGPIPIKAGQTLTLPKAPFDLVTADPAGPETFVVLVSEKQRNFKAIGAVPEEPFLKLPTGPNADMLLQQWTRPTPMLLGAAPAGCQGAGCDNYGAAKFAVEVVR
ncbi:DUF4384 domain-containing protein, partial [Pelomonas sp. KK5]|uniref:DUF4384 domain-containing protein n=1 Tax=Pelomonas sp. KK5 TaxID=1855730 RepID=UPI00117EBB80